MSFTLNRRSSVTVNCRSNCPVILLISFCNSLVSDKTLSISFFCFRIFPIISNIRDVYAFLQKKKNK